MFSPGMFYNLYQDVKAKHSFGVPYSFTYYSLCIFLIIYLFLIDIYGYYYVQDKYKLPLTLKK